MNIRKNKTETIESCDQTNKRQTYAIVDFAPQRLQINEKISKSAFQPFQQDVSLKENILYKHIEPALPPRKANLEKNKLSKIKSGTYLVYAPMYTASSIIVENGNITTQMPATLCTEPLLLQDSDYQDDFLAHLREREDKVRPIPHYLRQQLDIDHTARAILVNWLVSVVREIRFDTETLYLAVSYIDRLLSHIVLPCNELHLIGVTAVYIAGKFEETRPPGVAKFAFIGGIKFETKQIVKMERLLLRTLEYDLHTPTSYAFTVSYMTLLNAPHLLKFLTLYICELTLLEAEPYLQFLPSQISAASHALSRYLLGYSMWSKQLEDLTLYRLEDLKQIFLYLCQTHSRSVKLLYGATRMKFMEERYHQVALISPISMNEFVFQEVFQK